MKHQFLDKDNELAKMHDLMGKLNTQIAYETGTTGTETTAEQALEAGRGVCQDHAHVFIACARQMGTPARYVSGHLLRRDGQSQGDRQRTVALRSGIADIVMGKAGFDWIADGDRLGFDLDPYRSGQIVVGAAAAAIGRRP